MTQIPEKWLKFQRNGSNSRPELCSGSERREGQRRRAATLRVAMGIPNLTARGSPSSLFGMSGTWLRASGDTTPCRMTAVTLHGHGDGDSSVG